MIKLHLMNLITMVDQKPLFKSPYDIKDVSALFSIIAFVLIIRQLIEQNVTCKKFYKGKGNFWI